MVSIMVVESDFSWVVKLVEESGVWMVVMEVSLMAEKMVEQKGLSKVVSMAAVKEILQVDEMACQRDSMTVEWKV